MTDRAKKISELETTISVANTDKIVVLKDAANTTTRSTKAMTVNNFALSIAPLFELPGAVVERNSIVRQSNGLNLVPFFTFDGNAHKSGEIRVHLEEAGAAYTMGHVYFVKNNTDANCTTTFTYIGDNIIYVDIYPTVNSQTGVTTFNFTRDTSSTANIDIRYVAMLH